MQDSNYRPIKDYRMHLVNSITNDDEYRPSVETLEKKYARVVEHIEDETRTKQVKLVKRRGTKRVVKLMISTLRIRQLLNRALPKIKRFSQESNGFSVSDFQVFMRVRNTAVQKYINLLLAAGLIKHDGKQWASKYIWNEESVMRHL